MSAWYHFGHKEFLVSVSNDKEPFYVIEVENQIIKVNIYI